MKRETALKSVLILQSNINLNSKQKSGQAHKSLLLRKNEISSSHEALSTNLKMLLNMLLNM